MKTGDLMPYDFVCYRKNKQVVKVFEVDADRDVINTEFDGYNGISWIHISDLEPIPLTTEILLKNGFSHEKTLTTEDVCTNEKYSIKILSHNNMLNRVLINSNIFSTLFWEPFAVHRFQHILRVCNLANFANSLKI